MKQGAKLTRGIILMMLLALIVCIHTINNAAAMLFMALLK